MWAASQQHPGVVRLLIDYGADVRARSTSWTQLVASEGGDASAYQITQGGFTALLFAVRVGDLESATLLLSSGADVNDTAPAGASALVLAAHSGHGVLAAYLLERGADPNAAGAGYTALHAAVLRSDLDLVKALLAHGATPNARLTRGTPVRRTSEDWGFGHAMIGATPFWLGARYLAVDIMRLLLAAGADPGIGTSDQTTALMAAAGVGTRRKQGNYSLNRRGHSVLSPKEMAIWAKDENESVALQVVTLLVDLGAEVNARNRAGATAVQGASANGLKTVVQLLLAKGATMPDAKGRGQTPVEK
jgi:ankyrin repeat protein